MANSSLKLYYFDGKCRAEVSRLILTAAGKQFEDIRFKEAIWPKYRPLTPFARVPVLEIDGERFGQSMAICTFLAREFGFYGDTSLECLRIDQVVQLVFEYLNVASDIYDMAAGPEKEKALAASKQEKGPEYLGYLEQLLKKSGTGYFVGNKLTLADFVVFDMLTGFMVDYMDFNDNYPTLQKFAKTILAHDKIGPYIASRPEAPF